MASQRNGRQNSGNKSRNRHTPINAYLRNHTASSDCSYTSVRQSIGLPAAAAALLCLGQAWAQGTLPELFGSIDCDEKLLTHTITALQH